MTYVETSIGRLIAAGEYKKAHDEIASALKAAGGNTTHTALRIGVDLSTFKRWVMRLEREGQPIRATIQRVREGGFAPLSSGSRDTAEQEVKHRQAVARAKSYVRTLADEAVRQLARGAGVSVATLRQWLDGETSLPSLEAAAMAHRTKATAGK